MIRFRNAIAPKAIQVPIENWKMAGFLLLGTFSAIAVVSIIPLNGRSLAEQQFVRVAQWFDRQNPYAYPFVPPSPADTLKALEQAIAVHKERIQQYPEDGLDRASLAGLYLKLARTTGEESWYLLAEQEARQSLINLPFFNDGAILTLARVAEAKHDFATAIGLAEQASGVEALGIVVTSKLALGDVEAADTTANALVNLTPTPGSFALRALTRSARGDRAAALQDFQQAIATEEPDDARGSAWVRTLLGRFYAEQGNLTLAGQLYREALNILPDYPLALLQLGELDTRLGRYRSAERWYAQLDNPLAWQGIARIQALRGNAAKAEVWWDRAESVLRQQIEGNALGHRRDLATLLLERGDTKDASEAIALMQAEAHHRRDTKTLETLAWALSREGRWQEAQTAIALALDQGVRDARIFYRAAAIAEALGNSVAADTYYRQAWEVDPTFDRKTYQRLRLLP